MAPGALVWKVHLFLFESSMFSVSSFLSSVLIVILGFPVSCERAVGLYFTAASLFVTSSLRVFERCLSRPRWVPALLLLALSLPLAASNIL